MSEHVDGAESKDEVMILLDRQVRDLRDKIASEVLEDPHGLLSNPTLTIIGNFSKSLLSLFIVLIPTMAKIRFGVKVINEKHHTNPVYEFDDILRHISEATVPFHVSHMKNFLEKTSDTLKQTYFKIENKWLNK